MPAVIFDSEREEVKNMLCEAVKKGASHALVGNVGHICLAREAGLRVHGDHRFNISSSRAASEIFKLGLSDVIVSAELTLPQIRDIGGKRLATVYGKLPLMTLEKCVIKEIADCKRCEREGFVYLVDRKGVRFGVRREYKHRNLIFNSVPVYMADRADELCKYKIDGWHFIFSDESRKEVDEVIDAYISHRAPSTSVRRILK
jgi:collagenase-like PrtC family protease